MKNKPTLHFLIFLVLILICYEGYLFYNYLQHSEKNEAYASLSTIVLITVSVLIIYHFRKKQEVQEHRLRSFINASTEVFYLMNPDWSEMLHLKSGGFLESTEKPDRNWLQRYIHPEDQEYVTAVIKEAIMNKKTFELEHRVKLKDGSWGWTFSRAIPIIDKKDEIIEWFGTAADFTKRKKAEEELSISENRFRDLVETQQEMIIRIDTAGRFIFVNEAFCRKFGVNKNEFTGTTFIPLVHPDDLPLAFEKIREMEIPPYRASIEIREYTKEGLRWIEWNGTAIRDSDGKVIEFQAVGRDIHKRKTAVEALLNSESKLKEAQALAHLGSWELDLLKDELTWSDEVYRIFGLQPQEFGATYEAFLDAVHPDDREAVNEAYAGSIRECKDNYEIEHRVVRKKTGEVRIVHEKCNHFRDDTGKIIRSVGMVHDITERKKLQEELVKSEETVRRKLDSILLPEGDIGELELSDIIDSSSIQILMNNFYEISKIPMSIIDLKGKVLVGVGWQKICTNFHRVNPETNQFCLESDLQLSKGIKPGEFKLYKCKNNMWDMSSPIMIGGKHTGNLFIGQFFFENEPLDYELFRNQARKYGFNEEDYITALEAVPRLSEEKIALGAEFFIRLSNMISRLSFSNIELARLLSQLDLLMKSLKESQEDLKRSNKDLEQFAYSASHDLQEPIRMIKTYSQLIQMKNKITLDTNTQEHLNFIEEGAGRMQQLIDGLLQYSRIAVNNQEFETVDCNLVLKEVINDFKFRIQEEEVIIETDELPVVKGNSILLRQLFQNFLQNAIKFRSERRPEIKISCERRDGSWLFSIKDNGIGIDAKFYERIFIIFQRLHDREKYPGTGIGLSICKKIVERHGGKVFVESEVGKGTVFYFTIPVL